MHSNPLGAKLDSFRPMLANVFAGFVLGLLASCAGLALLGFPLREAWNRNFDLPFYHSKGFCWVILGFCILGGGLILAVGIGFALFARRLIGHRVDLHEFGLRVFTRGSFEEMPWSEIERIEEIITYERPPILTGAAKFVLPELASRSYVVHRMGGKQQGFDGNSIKAINKFGRLLLEFSARAGVFWTTTEAHA